jgi:hypothetical protein
VRFIHGILRFVSTTPEFYLPDRDAIELAWLSAYTTGDTPTLTPLLDAMIDLLPPRHSDERDQGASLYLAGEVATVVKRELVYSLGHMATYSAEHATKVAASALLLSMAA